MFFLPFESQKPAGRPVQRRQTEVSEEMRDQTVSWMNKKKERVSPTLIEVKITKNYLFKFMLSTTSTLSFAFLQVAIKNSKRFGPKRIERMLSGQRQNH